MCSGVQKQFGRLDVVFANAGQGEFTPLGEATADHFDRIPMDERLRELFQGDGVHLLKAGDHVIATELFRAEDLPPVEEQEAEPADITDASG